MSSNAHRITSFRKIYEDLNNTGLPSRPRGQLTIELLDYQYTLAPFDRFPAFPSRKLNLDYIKAETLWYLKGDLEDLSICDHAKIWADCVTYGKLHSNYGYYIFKEGGIDYVVDCLTHDKDSRRAVITILADDHLFLQNKDVPCTSLLAFHIRGTFLHCSVHMRSQDAVFGMGNDVPFFSIVQEMVLKYLQRVYPDLQMGTLTVKVDSFHAYERHFDLLDKLVKEEQIYVEAPRISSASEVDDMRAGKFDTVGGLFQSWLVDCYAPDA